MNRPIVVAVTHDSDLEDLVRMAGEMGRRIGAPVVPVHVKSPTSVKDGLLREGLNPHLAPLATDEGPEVERLVLLEGHPAHAIIEEAARRKAQLIMVGGGQTGTLKRWLFGSTAEAVVRTSLCPVYVVRGVVPLGSPILCPVDTSPQSRVGFMLALRMARAFETSLTPLTVVPEPGGGVDVAELVRRTDTEESHALSALSRFLEAVDTHGVEVTPKASVGPPSQRVVEAADEAGLVVIGSRGFDMLRPTALGSVTTKVVRFAPVGVVCVRDPDPDHDEREAQLQRVADLKHQGKARLTARDPQGALPLLQLAARLAPANAAVQLRLAEAFEGVGRTDEAAHRRALAAMIRERFV